MPEAPRGEIDDRQEPAGLDGTAKARVERSHVREVMIDVAQEQRVAAAVGKTRLRWAALDDHHVARPRAPAGSGRSRSASPVSRGGRKWKAATGSTNQATAIAAPAAQIRTRAL